MYRGGRPVLTKRSFYYDRRKNRTERFFDSSNRFPAVGARVHARGTSYANRKAKSRRIFRKSDRRACSRREYIAFPPNCSSFTERHGTVERHGTLPRPPLSLSLSLSHSLSHSLSLSPLSFPLSLSRGPVNLGEENPWIRHRIHMVDLLTVTVDTPSWRRGYPHCARITRPRVIDVVARRVKRVWGPGPILDSL